MDARLLDDVKRLNRAFEFSFEGPTVVDVFGKIRNAEVVSVKQLKSDASGLRQARACHF